MSELHPRHDIPDTMTFTDEERALARQKQQEAAAAKKKRRNKILASVAGGATLIGGGIVAGLNLGSGGGSHAAPDRSPAASAKADPTDSIQNNPNILKLPEGIATMDAEVDAGQQQAAFDKTISPVISKRVDNNDLFGANNTDLVGLTGGTDIPALDEFAHFTASTLKSTRKELSDKLGPQYAMDSVAIKSTLESSHSNPDGTTTAVADVGFWLLDKDGLVDGHMIANTERYSVTYKDAQVAQPDGTVKTVALVNQFEHLDQTAN